MVIEEVLSESINRKGERTAGEGGTMEGDGPEPGMPEMATRYLEDGGSVWILSRYLSTAFITCVDEQKGILWSLNTKRFISSSIICHVP